MTEDNKVNMHEILDEIDQLLTEEDLEGEVTLWDLVLESLSEVVEERMLYGNDEYNDEAFAQIEFGRRYVAEDMSILASAMESFGKSGHSVAEWAEATYSVSPITGDSLTEMTLSLTNKTEERARPRKRGERCNVCSNMTKKELKKYDSCPSCGRSLFALKGRGW